MMTQEDKELLKMLNEIFDIYKKMPEEDRGEN